MITVDYFGRSGNNWFQYVYARLLSMKKKEFLLTSPPKSFLQYTEYDQSNNFNNACIHLHDYFQKTEFYNEYRDEIKKMFVLPPIKKNVEDIVVHLRLTDYWWSRNLWVISPIWYLSILRREKYKKCYIVVEPHKTNDKYLRAFSHLKNVEIVSKSPAEDFEFIRNFDRIICSNSTFCWWAAFLSEASKIYTFKPWIRDKKVDLATMGGAICVDGSFIRDRKLETIDWMNYWLK